MKLAATVLVAQATCPFLRYVQYEVRQPLPILGVHRRRGLAVHDAIAVYERSGRSIERALAAVDANPRGLGAEDLAWIREVLFWRHDRRRSSTARLIFAEGALRTSVTRHRLDVRMDRLDGVGEDLLLAEYKGGRRIDLELVLVQLRVLSYAILQVFGRSPRTWEVELLGTRKLVELRPDQDSGELSRLTTKLAWSVVAGEREPVPFDLRFCKRCPVRRHCPRSTSRPMPLRSLPCKESGQLVLF